MKEAIKYEDAAEYVTNAEGWVCKKCRRYWGKDKHMAQWCCATDLPCEAEGCTNRRRKPYTLCDACRRKKDDERDQKRLDAAKLCEDDGNPFVVHDNFYLDMDAYIDAVEQGEDSAEEFAFMSRQLSLDLCADEIWDDALERLEIDEPESIDPVGWNEFRSAVEKFVEANSRLNWWAEDASRKFKLPEIPEEES